MADAHLEMRTDIPTIRDMQTHWPYIAMVDSGSNIWMINCFNHLNLMKLAPLSSTKKTDIIRLDFSKYMDLYILSIEHVKQGEKDYSDFYNIHRVDLD